MGTLLKYVIYALVIAAIYFIAVGIYQGKINQNTTISEVTQHVGDNTKQTLKDGYNTTKEAIQNGVDTLEDKAQNAHIETKETIEE